MAGETGCLPHVEFLLRILVVYGHASIYNEATLFEPVDRDMLDGLVSPGPTYA